MCDNKADGPDVGPNVASSTKRAAELLSDAVILLHADAEDQAIDRIRSAGALLGLRIDTTAQMYQDLKNQWPAQQQRQFYDRAVTMQGTPSTSDSLLMQDAAAKFDPDKIFGTIK